MQTTRFVDIPVPLPFRDAPGLILRVSEVRPISAGKPPGRWSPALAGAPALAGVFVLDGTPLSLDAAIVPALELRTSYFDEGGSELGTEREPLEVGDVPCGLLVARLAGIPLLHGVVGVAPRDPDCLMAIAESLEALVSSGWKAAFGTKPDGKAYWRTEDEARQVRVLTLFDRSMRSPAFDSIESSCEYRFDLTAKAVSWRHRTVAYYAAELP